MNYTSTIDIPTIASEIAKGNYVEYSGSMSTKEELKAYREHYQKHTEPIFDKQHAIIRKLERSQPLPFDAPTRHILWNKCRYFEMSEYDKSLRLFVARSAKIKVKWSNMFVGDRTKLEAVVRAYNKKGIRCIIEQNWI